MIFTGIFMVQISSKIILGRRVGLVRILIINYKRFLELCSWKTANNRNDYNLVHPTFAAHCFHSNITKLSTFHTCNQSLRQILRIFWPKTISNKDLLEGAERNPWLLSSIGGAGGGLAMSPGKKPPLPRLPCTEHQRESDGRVVQRSLTW